MFKRAVLLLPLACLTANVACAVDDPMLGVWKLNPEKSTLIDEMKVASLGGNKYSFDFGGGTPEIIVADGTDQPGLAGTTLAVTAVSPEAWKVVRKKEGRVEIVGNWTLSNEGTVLRDDYTEFSDNGKTMHVLYLYDRRGSGEGFAGDWISKSAQMNTSYVVQVRAYEGDGLSIIHPAEGTTTNVKLDGRDYPNVARGRNFMSSGQRVDARTVVLTNKIGGKTLSTTEISVSEDGKTLTMRIHTPRRSEPNVLVFERQ